MPQTQLDMNTETDDERELTAGEIEARKRDSAFLPTQDAMPDEPASSGASHLGVSEETPAVPRRQ